MPRGKRRLSRRRDDRGAGVVQLAILATFLISIPMMWVQTTMYFHARNVATAAARQGLEAARTTSGTDGAGQSTAEDFIDQAGGGLTNASVTVSRTPEQVTVTVSGDVATLVPGVDRVFDVEVSVVGPVERFEP